MKFLVPKFENYYLILVGGLPAEEVAPEPDLAPAQEAGGNYSDATASAPGSDDDEEEEGSTAALDGSTLRGTPPADIAEPLHVHHDQGPGSGAGSESGASVNESIVGEQTISGRSSAYEAETGSHVTSAKSTAVEAQGHEATEWEATNAKLHSLRLSLLNQLVTFMPGLREVGGPRCIPFLQVRWCCLL